MQRKLPTFLKALLILLISSLILNTTVYADDVEDVLNVYGMTLGKPIVSELEQEISDLEQQIQDRKDLQAMDEKYNSILSQYIEKREQLMGSILSDISIYQSRNKTLSEYISGNILEADIKTLLSCDSSYKSNNSNMNTLLESVNNFYLDYNYKDVTYDTSEFEVQLLNTKELYVEALDTYDVGDVKNIRWILPNERHINSSFGYRVDPLNSDEIRFHSGTDYHAYTGTEIGALFNGVVISCGWSDTIGYFITVQSGDNIKYLVCHLSKILVTEGQWVNQYDTIGLVGGTGTRCTGPHLHLALYINGNAYDVERLFKNAEE